MLTPTEAARTGKELVMKAIWNLLKSEEGTETLEWGLVCGLIVVGAITAIALIGPKVKTMWDNMNTAIP
jgi:Flp pilus assembly pilin Flp